MKDLPEKLTANFTVVSEGIFGYVLQLPPGFEVMDTKITATNQMDDPSQKRYVVGIRLRKAT